MDPGYVTAYEPPAAAGSAHQRVEQVARASYGRLLAILAARTGDIELAEDALADAFASALSVWPNTGAPDNPEAWLLTAARNRRRDAIRADTRHPLVALAEAPLAAVVDPVADVDPDAIPDRRLALLFVCAHPAIDPAVRTPLMLQTVLGFDAARIARALAMPTPTLAQRLVRAKRRIRDARIPFAIPDRDVMPERLPFVLEAIYGTYAIVWQQVSGTSVRESMAGEALFLAETLAMLLDDEPETLGLAALLALSLSRANARGSADEFIPLDQQDPARWDGELMTLGERYLARARALGGRGRFLLEAEIQAVHAARARSGVTDWETLRALYMTLVSVAPTLGARVALAATIGRVDSPEAGLAALDAIEDPGMAHFQPAWATRAHLLACAARPAQARAAYEKAISLTTEVALRRYLARAAI